MKSKVFLLLAMLIGLFVASCDLEKLGTCTVNEASLKDAKASYNASKALGLPQPILDDLKAKIKKFEEKTKDC